MTDKIVYKTKLTENQKGIYFEALYEKDIEGSVSNYNLSASFLIKGNLDVAIFEKAVRYLIGRHSALRVSVVQEDGIPLQALHADVAFSLDYRDLSGEEEQAKNRILSDELRRNFVTPFDIAGVPLIRLLLLKKIDGEYLALICIHHMIVDGWSMGIMAKELLEVYKSLKQNLPPTLAEIEVDFIDYADWQNAKIESGGFERERDYWLNKLAGSRLLKPPADFSNVNRRLGTGREIRIELDRDLVLRLKASARSQETSLFTMVLAAFKVLLHKYTGETDIVVSSPFVDRPYAQMEMSMGLFLNDLPLRDFVESSMMFCALVDRVKETIACAYKNVSYPGSLIVKDMGWSSDIENLAYTDIVFGFDVVTSDTIGTDADTDFEFEPFSQDYVNMPAVLMVFFVESGDALRLAFQYNDALILPETARRMLGHYTNILQAVADDQAIPVGDINMMSQDERAEILHRFNDTKAEYPRTKTLHRLFEEQAARTPKHIALVYEDKKLTYKELNVRANQVAHRLREKTVRPDAIVGLVLERSLEMVVGILAILKAGGAYLPVEPDYPADRIRYILEDSKAAVLLSTKEILEKIQHPGECLDILDASIEHADKDNPRDENKPGDVAYVIYTSGTTGKPKGMMIEHRNVVRLFFNDRNLFDFNDRDVWTMFHSFGFDFSVWEMYGALLYGGRLVIVPKMVARDTAAYLKLLKDEQVTILNQTPSAFYNLIDEDQKAGSGHDVAVRMIIFGGEALMPAKLSPWRKKYPHVRLINMYGITETTVHVTYKEIGACEIENNISNIGRPIPTLTAYVMDERQKLLPVGVAGELCVGGEGVGRGYLNRPELTAEKFIANPYMPDDRLYRSGDLVRYLPNGEMEYLGRIDSQVKIRGFRIELGEIESRLLSYAGLKESVVIDRQDGEGNKYLCAYYVSGVDLPVENLRRHLSENLPDYMIPSYFIRIEKIPLTPNGKIDRRALPEPSGDITTGAVYEAPRNEVEETLLRVWQDVLGASRAGINDNFFALGGDSIKTIQIVSRLKKSGIKLDIRDIFLHPTIKDLTRYVKKDDRTSFQGIVAGELPLTPIQRWFFEQNLKDPNHFNQSVLLHAKEGLNENLLKKVFDKLVEHHDALRLSFAEDQGTIKQTNRGINGSLYTLDVHDLINGPIIVTTYNQCTAWSSPRRKPGSSSISLDSRLRGNDECRYYYETVNKKEQDAAALIEQKSNDLQASLNIGKGPLIKACLFHTNSGDHLLIVIHHLAVDGVSWRILLEDLTTGYDQAAKGENITLPLKTDSYKMWAETLSDYAQGGHIKEELAYWQGIKTSSGLPKDQDIKPEEKIYQNAETVEITFDKSTTGKLLRESNRAYNTEINDLLLTALSLTISDWTKNKTTLINLEGHGREQVGQALDITRTIGWFTCQYPVAIDINQDDDLSTQIKQTKEQLRRIPQKGIGYGILKYLTKEGRDKLHVEPEISFNYLGEFAQTHKSTFALSPIKTGRDISLQNRMPYALDINGYVEDGKLCLSFEFNSQEYRHETMEKVSADYKLHLERIIAHCAAKEEAELTPSDLGYQDISLAELEALNTEYASNIQDIYVLSPMQEGMLFHHLMDSKSNAYFEQFDLSIEGAIEKALLEESFRQIVQRHDILRTVFRHNLTKRPVQIVLRQQNFSILYSDVTTLVSDKIDLHAGLDECPSGFPASRNICNSAPPSQELHLDSRLRGNDNISGYMSLCKTLDSSTGSFPRRRESSVEDFKQADREKGFNPAKDVLMRAALFKIGPDRFRLIWSFHHIVMDGWCLGVLYNQLLQIYAALKKGMKITVDPPVPYKNYIDWLEGQDRAKGLAYWKSYLDGYETKAVVPRSRLPEAADQAYRVGEHVFALDEATVEKILQIASANQVTVNTLFQTVWGIILQRYNNAEDVVFGAVVSGRPPDIEGVESMVGLFINTVPVRISAKVDMPFLDLLKNTQQASVQSRNYDAIALADIQSATPLGSELLDHVLAFENYPFADGDTKNNTAGFRVKKVNVFEQVNYDFGMIVQPGRLYGVTIHYNANVFDAEFIERLGGHYQNVMGQVIANPQMPIRNIELVGNAERDCLLGRFNAAPEIEPVAKTIHELFEEQAAKTPDNTAVAAGEQTITYRELNARANQLAHLLRQKSVKPDSVVGLKTGRSIEMIVGMLGILKSGGAYLPIDIKTPRMRIRHLVQDSGMVLLLTDDKGKDVEAYGCEVLSIAEALAGSSEKGNPENHTKPEHLVYVIYTSGSTGVPKGVLVEHKGLVNLVLCRKLIFGENETSRITQVASPAFDATAAEVWPGLLSGSTIYIVPEDVCLDPQAMKKYLLNHQITHSYQPTVIAELLLNEDWPREGVALLNLQTAGDRLKQFPKRDYPFALYNLYGPTEDTVWTTCGEVRQNSDGRRYPAIGRPIPNHQVYIVNAEGVLQPIGIPGELCIGGAGLARGYLNRNDLTAERFVPNPFQPGKRMYRTGDLARWISDGTLEFLGRIDAQVKIRGFRIELGEIESRLLAHSDIQKVVVIDREDENGLKYLCAYYVSDAVLTVEALREHLASTLPEYMIPAYFVRIEKVPLTQSGKIDKKALPAPSGDIATATAYEAPATDDEEKLLAVWQDLLGRAKIGMLDDFFSIGGNSILAIRLLSMLQKQGYRITIGDIFHYKTIRSQARYLADLAKKDQFVADAFEAQKRLQDHFQTKECVLAPFTVNGERIFVLYANDALLSREKEIMAFVEEVLDESIYPRYFRPLQTMPENAGVMAILTPEEFGSLLNLRAEMDDMDREVIGQMSETHQRYEMAIKKAHAVVRAYEASSIQKGTLQSEIETTGTVIYFNRYLDIEKLKSALIHLVRNHALLRSVLAEEDGALTWQEYKAPMSIDLPFIDLSDYSEAGGRQALQEVARMYFKRERRANNRLLYKMALVKLDLCRYLLVFIFDHTSFDGLSADIIKRYIQSHYDTPQMLSLKPASSYADYIAQVSRGPQGLTPEELVFRFQLDRYQMSAARIQQVLSQSANHQPTLCEHDIPVDDYYRSMGEDKLFELCFVLFCRFCGRLFDTENIPATLVYHGRKYEDRDYFDTVGEFLDLIPISVENGDPERILDAMHTAIRTAATHNINFSHLLLNPRMKSAWHQVTECISSHLFPGPTLLVFNALQGFDARQAGLLQTIYADLGHNNAGAGKQVERPVYRVGLQFQPMIGENVIKIAVASVFDHHREELLNILKGEAENLFI